MHFQFRSDNDDGTSGIVHALAEEVHTETPLLALQKFGERLERAVGTGARRATTAIKQLVHRFLEHPLFVAKNNIRSLDVDKLFQTVVAVYDPTIEFVQVGSRKATAI